MILNIHYKLSALHDTAQFIWDNNPSVKYWPSRPKSVLCVIDHIRQSLVTYAKKNAEVIVRERRLGVQLNSEWTDWTDYTGTGGYYVMYSLMDEPSDEINLDIEILVDLSVARVDKGYVREFIDTIGEDV